ncbi:MAG: gliding motility protein GldN [Porphyromonadaceae bacterium]|nr:gliding motility protein GldN [Porphyromonadaceae bacterium]
MKKNHFIIAFFALLVMSASMNAQDPNASFFDEIGNIRMQTIELDGMADTIAVINHRAEDITWSRVVYRVIDMRDKQNFQLYFPSRTTDEYKSLFRLMVDAVIDGINVYKRNPRDIKPQFNEILTGEELSRVFAFDELVDNNLVQVDPITEQRTFNGDQYMRYVRNQLKFLIQEVIFFDSHTSRLYSKIIAIAPMYALHPDNMANMETMAYFRNSVLCWFSFDELRPYLMKQYVIPSGNDSQRLTYDEFFAQNLYSSYILGDSNMYSRMLLEFSLSEEALRAEQRRIETELLNFEQDLWEN